MKTKPLRTAEAVFVLLWFVWAGLAAHYRKQVQEDRKEYQALRENCSEGPPTHLEPDGIMIISFEGVTIQRTKGREQK